MKRHLTHTVRETLILVLFSSVAIILVVTNMNENNARVIDSDINMNKFVSNVSSMKCECNTITTAVKKVSETQNSRLADFTTRINVGNMNAIRKKNEILNSSYPTVFVITPTYTRPTQMPDMTRLAQTLMHVKQLVWIVVEDSKAQSALVRALLERTKLEYVHLLGPRPEKHLDKKSGRGVSNRIKGFEWLRAMYANTDQKGVIYLADDDNSYDIRLFNEIRDTKKVSMFPVGLIGSYGLSTPVVSKITGKIVGFHDPWISGRKFAIDMAGFAVNLQYFLSKPNATMPYIVGYEEDSFIRSLDIELSDIEPKAQNCTEILVWHTQTASAAKSPLY